MIEEITITNPTVNLEFRDPMQLDAAYFVYQINAVWSATFYVHARYDTAESAIHNDGNWIKFEVSLCYE